MKIKPQLEVLPEGQRLLWPHLRDMPKNFVLYGGTAIALRFGHRQSVDFDFFTSKQGIDLQKMGEALPFVSKLPHTTKSRSENHVDFNIKVQGKPVQLTLLNDRTVIAGSINPPDISADNNIKIATPIDLMACKVLAIHNRISAKDFIDIAEMVKQGTSLQKGFEAAQAIAKISPFGADNLMFDMMKEYLCSNIVTQTISSEPTYSSKSEEYVKILRQAAQSVDIKKVHNTSMKAQACIERNATQELER